MALDLLNIVGQEALTHTLEKVKDMKTGLESEIAKKADKTSIPTQLPNPNALTFTGNATGTYDGSSAITIEIPTPEGLTSATSEKLGGIKANAKSSTDTVPAKIGDDDKLYVPTYPTTLPASDVYDWAKEPTKPEYTKSEVGLSNVDNEKQIKGLASGTNANHVVTWGADGYTVKDSGFTIEKSVPSNAEFTDTKPVTMTGATSTENGTAGYVPAPTSADVQKFLKADGTWGTPDNTTYADATQTTSGLMPATDKKKLDEFSSASDYALKSDLTTVYRYKGSLANDTELPASPEVGDTYNLIQSTFYGDGANVAWDGTGWDNLGSTVNLSGYVQKSELGEIGNAQIDAIWDSIFSS